MHLGEVCADGNQDAYHCWLTLNERIIDFGIYGNSNYNPYFHGERLNKPVIFSVPNNLVYIDGSTETHSWLAQLSETSIIDYIKKCPHDWVVQLFSKSLDIPYDKASQKTVYDLANGINFPALRHINQSPSGRWGV